MRKSTTDKLSIYKSLIVLIIIFFLSNLSIQAQNWYSLQDDDVVVENGIIVSCSTNSSIWGVNNLIIPQTLDGQTVVGIIDDSNGIFNGKGIDSLQLPNTLKRIGNYAFHSNLLTNLTLPEGVTFVGNGAFGSNSINRITFSSTIDTIGDFAFKNNTLTNLNITDGVEYIGRFAFDDNEIETLVLSNSVIKIDEFAFYENPIESLILSNNLTYIGKAAFALCDLTEVTIPNSVTFIGESAFKFNSISTLNIHDNVSYIGPYAFHGNDITSVTIPTSLTSIESSVFSWNELVSITIPDNIISIGSYAFDHNDLTSITIPGNVHTIGNYAFAENAISSITLTEGNKYINDYAFYKNSINSLLIPNSVDSIGNYAFSENIITSITLSEGTKSIMDYAFYINEIDNLTIPSSVKYIGNYAFSENNMGILSITDTIDYLGNFAFSLNNIEEITLPNIIKRIGFGAFNNNSIVQVNGETSDGIFYNRNIDGTEGNEKIVSYGGVHENIDFIPLYVNTIGIYSFYNSHIKKLKIPFGVTSIEDFAFSTNQIDSLFIPGSVDSIGQSSFYENEILKLKFDTISSIRYIGSSAFQNNNIEELIIPNSINSIKDYAFALNPFDSISFHINSSVTSIGEMAFYSNNSSLTSISLPAPVLNEGFVFTVWKNNESDTVTEIAKFYMSYNAEFKDTTSYEVSGSVNINKSHGLLLSISGDYDGTIVPGDDGIFNFLLNEGRNITLSPVREGYSFTPQFIEISDIRSNITDLQFNSEVNTYNINFTADNNGYIFGEASQEVEYGTKISEVEAVPNDGCTFKEWQSSTQGTVSTKNPLVFTVTKSENLTAIFDCSIGMNIKEEENIRYYPNPATNTITIESPIKLDKIEVFDITGIKLATITNVETSYTFNVENYNSGIYFLQLTGKELNKTLKVLIE